MDASELIAQLKQYGLEVNCEKPKMFSHYVHVVGIRCPYCNEVFISTEPSRIYHEAMLHAYGCNVVDLPRGGGLCASCEEPCVANEEIVDAIRMGEEVGEPEIEDGKVTWCPWYPYHEEEE